MISMPSLWRLFLDDGDIAIDIAADVSVGNAPTVFAMMA